MKVITKPEVYLLGKQVLVNDELRRFLKDHDFENWTTDSPSDSETLVEIAARNCYQSFRGGRPHAEHIHHLLEVGHGSTLEHAVWNLVIVGVSRSLTHELIRHRAGAGYSQLSQRFVDESVAEYVAPPDLQAEIAAAMKVEQEEGNVDWVYVAEVPEWLPEYLSKNSITDAETFWEMADVGMDWLESVRDSHEKYVLIADYLANKAQRRGLIKTEARKFARQAARSVLPNATETKIFATLNARAIRNIVEQRANAAADPEIRSLAAAIHEAVVKENPSLFGDYEKVLLSDGTYSLTTEWKKV